jgi:hypothetical protein
MITSTGPNPVEVHATINFGLISHYNEAKHVSGGTG